MVESPKKSRSAQDGAGHSLRKGEIVNAILSSSLLATGMFLGQGGDTPSGPTIITNTSPTPLTTQLVPQGTPVQQGPIIGQSQPQQQQQQQQSRPLFGWFNREDRPIMSKIQGWFKRDTQDTPAQPAKLFGPRTTNTPRDIVTPPPVITSPPTVPSNDVPRKLPNPSSQNGQPRDLIVSASTTSKVTEAPAVQQSTVRYPIAAQFTNKIGRDDKWEWATGQIEVENGYYVLYYATPETEDSHRGRIVILPVQVDMSQFRRGDLISVQGSLARGQTKMGVVPVYRISHASLIERAKL